jgi:hypothetical protein
MSEDIVDVLIENRDIYTHYNGPYFDDDGRYIGDDLPESLFPGVVKSVGYFCISVLKSRELDLRMTTKRMIEFQLLVRRHCGYEDGVSTFDFTQDFIEDLYQILKRINHKCSTIFLPPSEDDIMDWLDLKIRMDYMQMQIALSELPAFIDNCRVYPYSNQRYALETMPTFDNWYKLPIITKRIEHLTSNRRMKVGFVVYNNLGYRGDYVIKTPEGIINPIKNAADTSVPGKYILSMELKKVFQDGDFMFEFICVPWSLFSKITTPPTEKKVDDYVILDEEPDVPINFR